MLQQCEEESTPGGLQTRRSTRFKISQGFVKRESERSNLSQIQHSQLPCGGRN